MCTFSHMCVKYSVLRQWLPWNGAYNAFHERDLQAAYESGRMGFGYDYEGQVHLGITAIIV